MYAQSIEQNVRLLLPRTGQTVSYAMGDDGWFQAGNPRVTRFVDNGDGTSTDRATGLQWVIDPSQLGGAFGAPGSPATMTWADACVNCLGTRYGGMLEYADHDDWRLSNVAELASLWCVGSLGVHSPIIAPADTVYTWTSSTYGNLTDWRIALRLHYPCQTTQSAQTYLYYARPVRGGRINANW